MGSRKQRTYRPNSVRPRRKQPPSRFSDENPPSFGSGQLKPEAIPLLGDRNTCHLARPPITAPDTDSDDMDELVRPGSRLLRHESCPEDIPSVLIKLTQPTRLSLVTMSTNPPDPQSCSAERLRTVDYWRTVSKAVTPTKYRMHPQCKDCP